MTQSNREFGDDLIRYCVNYLLENGVEIAETKGSGSVFNDCDAKTSSVAGFTLEGKASRTSNDIKALRADWVKAKKQSKAHGRIPVLVTSTKSGQIWIFTDPIYAKRLGMDVNIQANIKLTTVNWFVPKDNKHNKLKLTNKKQETMVAMEFHDFVDEIKDCWSINDASEEKSTGQKSSSKQKFRNKGRKFQADRFTKGYRQNK